VSCRWYGQGIDSGERGVGKAMTYAEKYFLLKFFNIPTDEDDPDKSGKAESAAAGGTRMASAEEITQVKDLAVKHSIKLEKIEKYLVEKNWIAEGNWSSLTGATAKLIMQREEEFIKAVKDS
jgi:hypothetical protein